MKLSTVFVVIVGLFYIALSIAAIVYFNLGTIFKSIPYSQNFQIAVYAVFGFFILITLLGIIGKIQQLGACKRSKALLFLYFILSLLIFIVVLGVGIASLVLGPKIFEVGVTCTQSTRSLNNWVPQIGQLFQKSFSIYGQSQQCKIYTNRQKLTSDQQIQIGKDTNPLYISDNFIQNETFTKVQDCKNFKENSDDFNKQIQTVIFQIENVFNCSRWCTDQDKPLYFLFIDINDSGIPENNGCFSTLKKFVDKWGTNFGIILVCISVVLLLNVILVGRHCSSQDNSHIPM